MAEREENIVLFPFMAQGHIIPFLALALHIEQSKNYAVTLVNTPLNIKKLRPSLPPNSSINLVEIPFSSSDYGLPPKAENTDTLPYHQVIQLVEAGISLKPSFKKLIENLTEQQGNPPLCIIADIFFGWTASIAKELNVFHAIFSGNSGFGLACYYSLWIHLPHRYVDSDEFSLPDFAEASSIHVSQLAKTIEEADGTDPWAIFHQKKNLPEWVKSDGILFNTVEEFDHVGLLYFRRKLGRPVWPIGPVLLSTKRQARAGKEGGISSELCLEWLNTKPLNSVLYVSFGSMNTISATQMMQLAMGLEASGKIFIWVVRPPIGFDLNSEFKANEWLPEGFEERIKGSKRGLLVHNWAPQVDILVLESLSHGVPIIGWPMAAEQFFNVKLLEEELGVCVELARGKSCEIRHEDIVEKIELVMNETKKGNEMRSRACEVMEIIKNAKKDEEGFKGCSVKALDDFFSAALSMRKKTKKEED
ncbi:hypothetical protein CMV_024857 [Castanea mollissima]|uniref:Uncharacterized protein n=1 Tax=Castanea mollissima TaxID=60419 RepID=A0A8J4QLW1_9ROSI|nr:hypothetical protein CMV_024857 [Castanea mollissima]